MQGLDAKYNDLPDYILKCTAQIWEGRDIAALDWHYAPDIIVRTPGSIFVGNESGKANTMATLSEFPDRVLLGEDVIWSGNGEEGFLSSHRIVSTATHSASGAFGPASNRQLVFRTIADTFVINNQVAEEWLVRDVGAMVRQLGHSPQDFARQQLIEETGAEQNISPFTPEIDLPGPYSARGNDNEWGERYNQTLSHIMNASFSVIPTEYDRACHLEYPGGATGHGVGRADTFWMGLRSAFPNAEFVIHHQIGRTDPLLSPRAALRWSLTGIHAGWGHFGAPSGAMVHVMGISHAEFGPDGIRREYVIFDEVAIWKQMLIKQG
jgi:hypothetical protein